MIDILKENMVSTYRKIGDNKAVLIRGSKSYTGNEIADEISKETEFGIKMVDMIIQLSIDLIKRDKINNDSIQS